MPRVIHFEISAESPERAVAFYGSVFGWKIEKWDPVEYWLVSTGDDAEPGIGGAITRRDKMMQGTINTIAVDSVDKYEELIQAKGGKILVHKHAIPGIGYMAYCRDTEDNVFGIMESDASAR